MKEIPHAGTADEDFQLELKALESSLNAIQAVWAWEYVMYRNEEDNGHYDVIFGYIVEVNSGI